MQLLLHDVLALACFWFVLVERCFIAQSGQLNYDSSEELDFSTSAERGSENAALKAMLNHTFVALIDIAFTDGTKRSCTGTIIHDNVVITAGHCFVKNNDKSVHPELTTSFVVVGSKKMFETGNEQYLPIERVISHPKLRCWKADIALVYTFAGMVSDKPGTLIPLAGEKISIPNHCNVTVLSWGQKTNNNKKNYQTGQIDWNAGSIKTLHLLHPKLNEARSKNSNNLRYLRNRYSMTTQEKYKTNKPKKNSKNNRKHSTPGKRITELILRADNTDTGSDIILDDTDKESPNLEYENQINQKLLETQKLNYVSNFKHWRRSIGSEENDLAVENFKVVNIETCDEIIKKMSPVRYKLKNLNEYVCYTSDALSVDDGDAGAPAVRDGQLVAVTVGGVESDGDRAAVGIKISCFCSWIADNLPDKGAILDCCDHCCDEEKTPPPLPDESSREEIGIRRGKKKKIKI